MFWQQVPAKQVTLYYDIVLDKVLTPSLSNLSNKKTSELVLIAKMKALFLIED